MKPKYQIKNLDLSQVNAFFATISHDDPRPVVDLHTGRVSTLGNVAATYPRPDADHTNGNQDYLIIEVHHESVAHAQKWWDSLKRVQCDNVPYTIIHAKDVLPDDIYTAQAINGEDYQEYTLQWNARMQIMVPLSGPGMSRIAEESDPRIDWEVPIGMESAE